MVIICQRFATWFLGMGALSHLQNVYSNLPWLRLYCSWRWHCWSCPSSPFDGKSSTSCMYPWSWGICVQPCWDHGSWYQLSLPFCAYYIESWFNRFWIPEHRGPEDRLGLFFIASAGGEQPHRASPKVEPSLSEIYSYWPWVSH